MTEDETSAQRNQSFKTVLTISVSLLFIFLWLLDTYTYVLKKNELCLNGVLTKGTIYKVEDNRKNEGNMLSYDMYYVFYVGANSYSGLLNVAQDKRPSVNSFVNIVYSKRNPTIHQAFEQSKNVDKACTHFSIALFELENMATLLMGFVIVALCRHLSNQA